MGFKFSHRPSIPPRSTAQRELKDRGPLGAAGGYTAKVRAGHLREGGNEVESRDKECAGPQIGSTKSWNSVAKRLAENQQSRKQH